MIGTLLSNRYELLEKIGEGGMAEVYKAKCHKLNRFDAVKILKKEFIDDEELVAKFKREATAVANLTDNNIINIFDVGTQDDIHYIVMEYVKGRTLKQIIQENVRLSYERSIDIAIQISKALDCAHRNNIIHRDIKPQNILVTEDGVVKVTDFGIAKAPTSMTITNSSKVMGSAHYFSPEQAKGGYVDCRTDIYSLGVVMYEMVTGKVPFDAESPVSVALKHIQDSVTPPRQLNMGIPEGLNNLIMKALEKDPIRRYQTIKEVLIDLIRLQKDLNYDVIPNKIEDEFTKIMDPITVNDEDGEEDEEAADSKVSSKVKRILIFTLSAVLVVALGAIAGWKLSSKPPVKNPGSTATPAPTANPNEVIVPSIVGKSQEEAKKIVEDLGLKFVIVDQVASDLPLGAVTDTHPTEGQKVKKGFEIRITLSTGPKKIKVPNLFEIDLKSAKDILLNNELQPGNEIREFHNSVPEGAIIRHEPAADTVVEKGRKIDLVISKGVEFRYTIVPDLKGKTLAEAESVLKSAKLTMGNKTKVETSDKTLADMNGKVFNQDKEKDQKVVEGTPINVSWYEYKELPQP